MVQSRPDFKKSIVNIDLGFGIWQMDERVIYNYEVLWGFKY